MLFYYMDTLTKSTHLCVSFLSCMHLQQGGNLCVFTCLCHLVSLDESILSLEGRSVPGHFQDGGRHS